MIRRMRLLFQMLVMLSLIPICLFTVAAAPIAPSSSLDAAPNFTGLKADEANSKIEQIEQSKVHLESGLISQLQDSASATQAKVYCAYLLGQIRSVRACRALLEQIDLQPTEPEPTVRIARWGKYPAQEALCSIGLPAALAAEAWLKTEENPQRRLLLVSVMTSVEGSKYARERLQDFIAATQNPAEHQRLVESVKLIQ